eukprot:UN0633
MSFRLMRAACGASTHCTTVNGWTAHHVHVPGHCHRQAVFGPISSPSEASELLVERCCNAWHYEQ